MASDDHTNLWCKGFLPLRGSPLIFPSSFGQSLPKARILGTANPRSQAELARRLCGLAGDSWGGSGEKLGPCFFLFHLHLAAKLANERGVE